MKRKRKQYQNHTIEKRLRNGIQIQKTQINEIYKGEKNETEKTPA